MAGGGERERMVWEHGRAEGEVAGDSLANLALSKKPDKGLDLTPLRLLPEPNSRCRHLNNRATWATLFTFWTILHVGLSKENWILYFRCILSDAISQGSCCLWKTPRGTHDRGRVKKAKSVNKILEIVVIIWTLWEILRHSLRLWDHTKRTNDLAYSSSVSTFIKW